MTSAILNRLSGFAALRAFSSAIGMIAGGFLILLLLVAFFAPWITPFDVATQNLANANAAPGWPHIMGTDEFGRDVFSRVVYGARTSLSVSATAIGISVSVGMLLGAAAGYFGGMFERMVMTVVDLTWSFPDILIALIFVAIIGPGLTSTTFAIAIAYLAQFTRLTRAQIVRLKNETFVEATINLGATPAHVVLRHLLPNALAPVIVVGMLAVTSVFAVVTVLTMLAVVLVSVWGLRSVRLPSVERFSEAIAGGTIAMCGFSIAVLGL